MLVLLLQFAFGIQSQRPKCLAERQNVVIDSISSPGQLVGQLRGGRTGLLDPEGKSDAD